MEYSYLLCNFWRSSAAEPVQPGFPVSQPFLKTRNHEAFDKEAFLETNRQKLHGRCEYPCRGSIVERDQRLGGCGVVRSESRAFNIQ